MSSANLVLKNFRNNQSHCVHPCNTDIHIETFWDSQSQLFTYLIINTLHKQALVVNPILSLSEQIIDDKPTMIPSTLGLNFILKRIENHKANLQMIIETQLHHQAQSGSSFLRQQTGCKIFIQNSLKTFYQTHKATTPLMDPNLFYDAYLMDRETIFLGHCPIQMLAVPFCPTSQSILIQDPSSPNENYLITPSQLQAQGHWIIDADQSNVNLKDILMHSQQLAQLPVHQLFFASHATPNAHSLTGAHLAAFFQKLIDSQPIKNSLNYTQMYQNLMSTFHYPSTIPF